MRTGDKYGSCGMVQPVVRNGRRHQQAKRNTVALVGNAPIIPGRSQWAQCSTRECFLTCRHSTRGRSPAQESHLRGNLLSHGRSHFEVRKTLGISGKDELLFFVTQEKAVISDYPPAAVARQVAVEFARPVRVIRAVHELAHAHRFH